MDIFYQRPPFQTPKAGHVCRCIALGKVSSKGKARTAFHGLSLSPAATMPETALKQRPANTTPSPFVVASEEQGEEERGVKRDAATMEERLLAGVQGHGATSIAQSMADDGLPPPEPDTVFLGRLPANIEEKRIEAALKHVGKIERIHLVREAGEGSACKGFGFVTFSTPEEADAACDLSELLECGRPTKRSDGPRKKREIQIVVEPHADCWFCLVNPKVEKHMIVSASTEVYIATARGPVNPYHVQVLPVKHAPCFAACPPDLQKALKVQMAALQKMFADAGACSKTRLLAASPFYATLARMSGVPDRISELCFLQIVTSKRSHGLDVESGIGTFSFLCCGGTASAHPLRWKIHHSLRARGYGKDGYRWAHQRQTI
eukprot:s3300_g7.t1